MTDSAASDKGKPHGKKKRYRYGDAETDAVVAKVLEEQREVLEHLAKL